MTSLVRSQPRKLGNLPVVGPIAYGQWRLESQEVDRARELVEAALEAGMNLIDTADIYGFDGQHGFGDAEQMLGAVLASTPSLRDRMVLATKGGITPPTPYNSSPEWLTTACEASLRRLQTDRIDLYQVHRPDSYTHPEAVAETLTNLRESGKVREVGVSNYTVRQTEALQRFLDFPLATTQPEFSAVELGPMRDGTLDYSMANGTVPLAWSPLAGGALATGHGLSSELLDVLDRLAEREGLERSHIALAFVLSHPAGVIPIVGTQKVARIGASLRALDVHLDREDVYAIVQASDGAPLP
ncbi:putative oxidoreductase [Ilumatobacter fluminis]|uniref:Putative oxidoreductase n=1 Tax=Ilumatobacter fluminis TaxID=467091 RepID=A0A4R7HVH5_9ACTN|nr:aldo/keto reductase [Ilumatobacter fluminis]TDT14952.1 putative oxidoreductase [Ilumatobacter fluminis]